MWSCFRKPQAFEGPAEGLPDLAPFKTLRQIGRGAVGEVFLARHARDGQLYALKTVPLDAPAWRLELLKREERTYAALATDAGAHVGLLRPRRMQLLHDRLCLVTEWASGGTLAAFLQAPRFRHGVDEDLALFVLRQLVAAVERLHSNRVAYRDIKLENILLDVSTFGAKAPRVLLADFGTCKAFEEGAESCLASTFMGTPGFMAPQVLGSIFPPNSAPNSAAGNLLAGGELAGGELDDSARDSCSLAGGAGRADDAASASSVHSGPPASAAGVYDAVKADIYSLGAILMFMLFKELPFGFDKFSRLLPPGEALSVLWQLESEQSWRQAAGARLLKRKVSAEALDLLDRMLDMDEAARIDVAGIKAHPWFTRRLPRRYEAALAELAKEQARLDGARGALADRSSRRRAAPAGAAAGAAHGVPHGRPLSGVEAALEQLFDAASSPAALRRLREKRLSLFVDLAPDAVAEAWELGLQTESAAARGGTPAPAACGCTGGAPAPPPPAAAGSQSGGSEDGSVAGRSDSATTMGGGGGGRELAKPAAALAGDAAPALGLRLLANSRLSWNGRAPSGSRA